MRSTILASLQVLLLEMMLFNKTHVINVLDLIALMNLIASL